MDSNSYKITNSTNQEEISRQKNNKKSVIKTIGVIILVLLLMIASAFAGYWYREQKAKKALQSANQQISELQKQKKEAEDAKAKLEQEIKDSKNTTETTTKKTMPTAEVKNNIQDAIESGNTSALVGYMAPTVKVIVAASDGIGDRTPKQVVADLKYVDAGTAPWNFSVSKATLTTWRAGFYKQYFPENAVVGESANHYVISFGFDDAGKINTIFMTNDAKLLK